MTFHGIYLAFFRSQPLFFKIGMSKNLIKRCNSGTYRTAFGIKPNFTLWYTISSDIRTIEKNLITLVNKKYLPSGYGKEVYHKGENNEIQIEKDIDEILSFSGYKQKIKIN